MNTKSRTSIFQSRIRRLLLGFLLFAVVPGLPAQDPAILSGKPAKIRVEVDLVTVEVYALDGKGKPVTSLKKEDFRLYENGKRQEILSFDAVDGDASISPSAMPILDAGDLPRGKTVLIIFDENTIPSTLAQKMRASAARFVKEHMQAQDLFAVASWTGTMRIMQNLTDDREAVLAAIARPAPGYGLGDFEALLQALEQINSSIVSMKGQKSVLIYGRPNAQWPRATLPDIYGKTINSARKSNVIYYTVDPGPRTPITMEAPNLSITSSGLDPERIQAPELPKIRLSPVTYGANSLVADSGGFSITDLDTMDVQLDRWNRQISSYYILGFQSSNQRHDGDFRKIRVTTSANGVVLKHKPGYQDRRPIDVLAGSKQEQALLAALAAPGTSTQLPVTFHPAYFYDLSRPARVLIAAKLRTDRMTFKGKGAQMSADLNVMGVAYAENGSIAARFSETLPVSFEKEKEAEFRKQGVYYRNYFRLHPGRYRLKLAVSDGSNNLGSMEQVLEIPALPAQLLAGSSLVVAEQLSALPDLIQKLRARLLDDADPLLYADKQIQPSAENILPPDTPVPVFFRLYNLPAARNAVDLLAKARLIDGKGKEFALPPIPLRDNVSIIGSSDAAIFIALPFQKVPAGKYKLILDITESASSQRLTVQTDLELTN